MSQNTMPILHRSDWIVSPVVINKIIWAPVLCYCVLCYFRNHSPSLSFSLSPSGGMLSGFWFEFSCTHCCGCGSQLPNHPSAYLLPDWPAEESHWLPVCITTQAATILPLNPACPFTIYTCSSSLFRSRWLPPFALRIARPSSPASTNHWWHPFNCIAKSLLHNYISEL